GAAGTYCFLAAVLDWASAIAWIHLGILAAVLAVPVLWVLHRLDDPTAGHVLPGRSQGSAPPGTVGLVACYGIMGFGYILPATFLPAMALEVTDDSIVFGSAWPVFGLTAAASTLVAGTVMRRISRLRLWAASQGL